MKQLFIACILITGEARARICDPYLTARGFVILMLGAAVCGLFASILVAFLNIIKIGLICVIFNAVFDLISVKLVFVKALFGIKNTFDVVWW